MRELEYWTSRRVILVVLTVNVILLLLGITSGNIFKHYSEEMAGTYISVLLLLLIGYANFRIYRIRRPHLVWLLMALAFVFLAYDDLYEFHEGLDKDIHRFFGMTQTPLTDRLDDIIILVYALAGLAVLWFYRAEITRQPILFGYLGAGFAIVGLSVLLDVLTNDSAILRWLGISGSGLDPLKKALATFEEVCKLMAEAVFLAGFLEVLRRETAQKEASGRAGAPA